MTRGRLEAFSDGVIAILITIMVLELKAPQGASWSGLRDMLPYLLTYVLSFVYLGIYWTNHHHLLQLTDRVTGGVLWANLHLLFWLSLVPFVTGWMSENHFAPLPVALYGAVLLFSGLAFVLLTQCLVTIHGRDSDIARSMHGDLKGKLSVATYAVAIPLAFVRWWIAIALYALVAAAWFIPDPRIERRKAT